MTDFPAAPRPPLTPDPDFARVLTVMGEIVKGERPRGMSLADAKTFCRYVTVQAQQIAKQESELAALRAQGAAPETSADEPLGSLIATARRNEGLTQSELAERASTTQSVIARLENPDYAGHSLSLLDRVARAMGRRLAIQFVADGVPIAEGDSHVG